MIRKLYLSLDLNFKNKDFNEETKKVIQRLENLYTQTFVEISKSFAKENSIQKSKEIESELNISNFFRIILFLIVFFLPLGYSNKIGDFILKNFFKIPISIILLNPIFKSIKYKGIRSKIKGEKSNVDFKEILDEDTYDYFLKEILKELSKNQIKIIVILDELDKIKKMSDIESIFDNLKSIMLSNLATFIVIPGQELFYHLNDLRLEDNSYLDSLFSKNMHISTLNKDTYENVFKKLLVNEKDLEKIEVKEYLNNMYINSFGIIRKFFQNLNKEIIWEKEQSYINIREEYKDTSHSKILECFDDMYENIIAYNFPEPLEEYYKIQLYIWINKMKEKISFTAKDILNLDESGDFQVKKIILETNLNSLLEKLVNSNVLEKKDIDIKYYWKKDVDIKIKDYDFENQIYNTFIKDFVNFEKMIRNLHINLYKKENFNLRSLIKRFYEDPDFDSPIDIQDLLILTKNRNDILHGIEIDPSERIKLVTNLNNMKVWINIFIENYFYMLLKKGIINNDWNVIRNQYNVDITLENQGKYVFFDFKYVSFSRENGNRNLNIILKNMVNKFIQNIPSQGVREKVILIIFIEGNYNIEKFEKYLSNTDLGIVTKIFKTEEINETVKFQHVIDQSKKLAFEMNTFQ